MHYLLLATILATFLLLFPATAHQAPPTCQQMFDAALDSESEVPYASGSHCWGVIGHTGEHDDSLRAAGIQAKVYSLSWRQYMPSASTIDSGYVQRKRAELATLRGQGFDIILSLGYHDTPLWVHGAYPNSHYVNQWGEEYPQATDAGDLNLVFNPDLRSLAESYFERVFADFGTDFLAVRVGGGRYGELTYPPAEFNGRQNTYWVFDANAATSNPVPAWRPGDPSPNGEAERFLEWHLDALVDFQQWQIESIRTSYDGPIMVLYPSWGIRPGDIERAQAAVLAGNTPAERNGEIQRGFDFARQVAAIVDPAVIVTTTWLDADPSADTRRDPRYWSPVKYLHSLASEHPLRLQLFGENTGHGTPDDMALSVAQTRRYGLLGMVWFRLEELFSGDYASLDGYATLIGSPATRSGFLPFIHR